MPRRKRHRPRKRVVDRPSTTDRARAGLTWRIPARVRVDSSTDWGVRQHDDPDADAYNRKARQ